MFNDCRLYFSCLFCCNERKVIIIRQTDRDVSRERLTLATDTEHTHSDIQNTLILLPPSSAFAAFE